MAAQYKHFWICKDNRIWILEGNPAKTMEEAIQAYKEEEGYLSYSHTLMWDIEKGTCSEINLEDIIEEDKKEAEIEYKELISNIAYYGWAQAGGARY